MRFQLLTGLPRIVTCLGCQRELTGGSPSDVSASGRPLDTVYQDIASMDAIAAFYCESCAAKHAEGIDPTRAVKQFYSDTHGDMILC